MVQECAQVNDGFKTYNVRASRTLEGAVQHFLNKRISNFKEMRE